MCVCVCVCVCVTSTTPPRRETDGWTKEVGFLVEAALRELWRLGGCSTHRRWCRLRGGVCGSPRYDAAPPPPAASAPSSPCVLALFSTLRSRRNPAESNMRFEGSFSLHITNVSTNTFQSSAAGNVLFERTQCCQIRSY